MMVDQMLRIVQNLRLFLTAITPTAVTPTAVAPTSVIFIPKIDSYNCFMKGALLEIFFFTICVILGSF